MSHSSFHGNMLNPNAPAFDYQPCYMLASVPSPPTIPVVSSPFFFTLLKSPQTVQPLPFYYPCATSLCKQYYDFFHHQALVHLIPWYPNSRADGNHIPSAYSIEDEDGDLKSSPIVIEESDGGEKCVEVTNDGGFAGHRARVKYSLSRFRRKKGLISKRKETVSKDSKFTSFDINERNASEEDRTTVMIKNIPNKYREMLIEFLDSHCNKENEKTAQYQEPILSEYDFLYLPMDFKHKCNLGYAFVNFTTSNASLRLFKALKGYKWEVFDSKKICEVSYARIQGKNALVQHFKNSNFKCESDEFLPVILSPPRNGSNSLTQSTVIGRRIE